MKHYTYFAFKRIKIVKKLIIARHKTDKRLVARQLISSSSVCVCVCIGYDKLIDDKEMQQRRRAESMERYNVGARFQ